MSGSNVENLPPQVYPQVIRLVSKQLSDLVSDPPEGIRVEVNEEDVTTFTSIIDGPAGTPYFGGAFRVRLVLGKEYPVAPPKAYFMTKIFHPNVSRDGEICVNTLKKDWKPDLGLKHILLTIKCLLIVPNAESALNEEAGKLLLEHYDDYCKRARMMTEIHAASFKSTSSTTSDSSGPGCSSSSSSASSTSSTSTKTSCDAENNCNPNEPSAKRHAGDSKMMKGSSGTGSSSSGGQGTKSSRPQNNARRTLKRL